MYLVGIRSSFLSDKKIEEMCEQIKPELEKVLQEQLTADQEAFDKLISKVEQGLQKPFLPKSNLA
jgi:predicted transcriptional regulator